MKIEVFSASLADINKALSKKIKIDPHMKLLEHFHEFLDVFSYIEADKLLLYYSREIDHRIDQAWRKYLISGIDKNRC